MDRVINRCHKVGCYRSKWIISIYDSTEGKLMKFGTYTGKQTKVVLAAIKRQQFSELKELVTDIDPNAFIIVQEAHQVLGDGFSRYSKNAL